MDPLTHLLATRLLIGRDRATLLTGIAPDLAFYSTYPLWVLRRGRVRAVLAGGAWPVPPLWMVELHRAGHSLPVALSAAMLFRLRRGYWPQRLLGAYLLHLLKIGKRRYETDHCTWNRGQHHCWPRVRVAVHVAEAPKINCAAHRGCAADR